MHLVDLEQVGMELDIDDPFRETLCARGYALIHHDLKYVVYEKMEVFVKDLVVNGIIEVMEDALVK